MKVEIYADVICPWCYIGKRRVEAATTRTVTWRSFQLDPEAPATPGQTAAEMMSRWWGDQASQRVEHIKAVGRQDSLELNLELARPVNTFDAHRVLHLAKDHGRQDEAWEAMLRGYHTEGRDIADPETLTGLATQAGLPRTEIQDLLTSDTHAQTVQANNAEARERGVTGVPSLVIGDGKPTSAVRPVAHLRKLLTPPE
ncbi:DsbA family oxidoreductase [Kibdelosporangium aridum]|uniref:Predicted dithiol-disulfide isomerase, DsbA family n=1 Tax=Kibdelosporangium aridum TaxID=2030 RepID=A0A1W2FB40_KIBAR|nr:DsbA family oxidoreductase [Kibdelosporangium aridum]SMD18828.1 Predicted dithiol-disulfide isomerase, DsbA family [Kibdelosporangium aridum]